MTRLTSTLLATLTAGLLFASVPDASAAGSFSYSDLNTVLFKYVSPTGLVDYKGIIADPTAFNAFIAAVGKESPTTNAPAFPTKNDQLAYYINAYNAFAIKGVIDRPGIKNVDSVKLGFFVETKYTFDGAGTIEVKTGTLITGGSVTKNGTGTLLFSVGNTYGGATINLYNLENKVRGYGDPRIHFALNCQSYGCPRLPNSAFDPAKLDTQLDGYAKEFVTNTKKVNVDSAGVAHLSHIFDWYAKDFTAGGGAIAFINAHGGSVPTDAKVEWIPYDWTLSAQSGKNP